MRRRVALAVLSICAALVLAGSANAASSEPVLIVGETTTVVHCGVDTMNMACGGVGGQTVYGLNLKIRCARDVSSAIIHPDGSRWSEGLSGSLYCHGTSARWNKGVLWYTRPGSYKTEVEVLYNGYPFSSYASLKVTLGSS
jgi:hypothetical protein